MITKEQLMPFCSTDECRPMLLKPWTRGAFTYATNGRIIVRLAAMPDVEECPSAPDAGKMMALYKPATRLVPIPELQPNPISRIIECVECDGSGIVECDYGHEHQCPECDGSGKEEKIDCIKMKIGSRIINAKYLHMIRDLPNVMIQEDGEAMDNMQFTFDGGVGMISPMRFE